MQENRFTIIKPFYWGCLVLFLVGCRSSNTPNRLQEAWDITNHPLLWDVSSRVYSDITNQARLDTLPWSNYYWPTYKGGIAYRWQNPIISNNYQDYTYPIISKKQRKKLENDAIDRLSPLEKYDLYLGQHFELTQREKRWVELAVVDDKIQQWFGICHGSAAASIMEEPPLHDIQVANKFGQQITFFISDIKALLAKIYADNFAYTRFLGGRCEQKEVVLDDQKRVIEPVCRDINPGTFHLVLADFIADRRESFIADIIHNIQVWNYPVVGYHFTYADFREVNDAQAQKKYRAEGTKFLVDVDLTYEYVLNSSPSRQSSSEVPTATQSVTYTLEMDEEKKIIGGEWVSTDKPDFLWSPLGGSLFAGPIDYGIVRSLLRLSRQ